jgi:hypothetical protein
VESEVTAIETVAGRETYRIESTQTTDAIDLELMDLIAALQESGTDLGDLTDGEMTAEDIADMLDVMETLGVEMTMHIDRNVTRVTTWFDATDGIVARLEASSEPLRFAIEMQNVPGAGDISMGFDMSMVMTMELAE